MTAPTVDPERSLRLADRLAAARRARFVGRHAELELFRSALLASEPPFAVLHVHGPGGIGKTALLAEYAGLASDAGVVAVRLDGSDVDPSPQGFIRALNQALVLPEGASPVADLSQQARGVLLIDTYEVLGPLDRWLRESFLPQLPARTMIVIAPHAQIASSPSPRDAIRTDICSIFASVAPGEVRRGLASVFRQAVVGTARWTRDYLHSASK